MASGPSFQLRRRGDLAEILVLDNGLIGRGEHSFTLIKQVGEALARRGLRYRAFGAKSMDASVADELGVYPHFTFPLYFGVVAPKKTPTRRASILAKMLQKETDACGPSEAETWRVLNESFERDLDALPQDVWRGDNLLLFPGLSQNQILGLVRSLLARPEAQRPSVICQLMFAPNWTAWGRKARRGIKYYSDAFALARPLLGKSLFFTAENEANADLYRKKFRIEPSILPAPFGNMPPAAPLAKRARFGFFGYSKCEKGFHLLPDAIKICLERGVEADFTVQIQHSGWEPPTVAAEADLRRIQGVRLIEGVLEEKDFIAETNQIDAMLLPYDPVLFGPRGSGLFTQSVSAGRPIIASAGTFAGSSIARGEAEGELFGPLQPWALAGAIGRLVARFEQSQLRAKELAGAFAHKHSADAYVDLLLKHTTRPQVVHQRTRVRLTQSNL